MQGDAIVEEEDEEEDGFDMGGFGDLSNHQFQPAPLHDNSRGSDTKPRGHQRKATPVMDPGWVLNANANISHLKNIKFQRPKPQAGKLQLRPARQNRPKWDYTGPQSLYKKTDGDPTTSSSSTAEDPSSALLPAVKNISVNDAPPPQNVAGWTVTRVRMWAVQSLQAKFVDKFCAKVDSDKTNGNSLLTLDENWLKEAGFNVGFHRNLVLKRVNILKKSHADAMKNGAGARSSGSAGKSKSKKSQLRVSDRVKLSGGRSGIIRFFGDTHFGTDLVGIALDAPKGDNDGTFDGKRYFNCKPKHGVFTRASACELVR